MFADDLGRDFYGKIRGQRVLVIVNYDVDAICACKILQALFKTDYISYTLVTVDFSNELKTLFDEHHADEKYVIFINCGGTLDVVEEIEPEEDITFFILDSHRPIDVCNIYNDNQVVLLSKLENPEEVPEFCDIFRDDDSEEDDNDSSEECRGGYSDEENESSESKRRRMCEEAITKRRERKTWEEKRDKLMFEYSQYGYYGKSSALILFELAWKLAKDNFDVLWYAILGLSEQYLMNKITETTYVTECGDLQNHVSRLTHDITSRNEGENLPVHIELEKEYPFNE
ncbi:hypothetical protein RUM43_010922 [Polyplax serrata]|uniref:Uncharacterized protein n=1 Tax=Polyplax serrata TaxID=468196 RepID=A0AAN8S3E8_POLSC